MAVCYYGKGLDLYGEEEEQKENASKQTTEIKESTVKFNKHDEVASMGDLHPTSLKKSTEIQPSQFNTTS